MFHSRMFKTKFLLFVPLALVLILAVACGGGDDPTATPPPTISLPTNTPVPTNTPEPAEPTNTPAPTATLAPGETPQPTPEPTPTTAIVLPTPVPTPTPAPEVVIPRGGVLTFQHYASPPHWSGYEGTFGSQVVNEPLYNNLIEYNPETDDPVDLRGDVAKTWTLGSDSLSYTFTLDENAMWHDGTPLTAADVKFSLDWSVNRDETRGGVSPLLIDPYYKDSEIIDDHTIKVNMDYPAVAFLPYLALGQMSILPKHHVETGVDMKLVENVLGSGPFTLKNYQKDIAIEYTRNTNYWKEGRPYLDGMIWYIVSNGASSFASYKTGQTLMSASMVSVMPNSDAIRLGEEVQGGRIHWHGPASVMQIHTNHEREPWTDPRVRKALHLALHRQPIIELTTNGQATMGYPLPPGFWFAPSEEEVIQLPGFRELNGEKHPDDLAEAKRLMAEAGFPDGFSSTMMTHGLLGVKEVGEVVADQWRRSLGVDLKLDNVEVSTYIVRRDSGDYEAHTASSGLVIHDPEDMFTQQYRTDASYRRISRSTPPPRIDELYELQTREFDRDKRKALSIEAADIILEEIPWVPLYWVIRFMYADDSIQNFHINPSAYAQIYKWEHIWCDPSCNP